MKSTEIIGDIYQIKNELSTKNTQLQKSIAEYRDALVAEGVQEILQIIKESKFRNVNYA